jgi:hypothetical protein
MVHKSVEVNFFSVSRQIDRQIQGSNSLFDLFVFFLQLVSPRLRFRAEFHFVVDHNSCRCRGRRPLRRSGRGGGYTAPSVSLSSDVVQNDEFPVLARLAAPRGWQRGPDVEHLAGQNLSRQRSECQLQGMCLPISVRCRGVHRLSLSSVVN